MNALVPYLIRLKATVTTFSGLASLPVIREEFVMNRHALTDEQLNTAVVITRPTPGPIGLYVVSVGYFAAGVPGAVAGWLAMSTPALAIGFLMRFMGHRAENPRVKQILESVVVASAGPAFRLRGTSCAGVADGCPHGPDRHNDTVVPVGWTMFIILDDSK